MIDDFFNISQCSESEDGYVFTVTLNPECKVYEGHFPGHPVAPGVCSINMLKECAEKVTGTELFLRKIQTCRMLAVIVPEPDNELTVAMSIDALDVYRYQMIAEISSDGRNLMKIKAEINECLPQDKK